MMILCSGDDHHDDIYGDDHSGVVAVAVDNCMHDRAANDDDDDIDNDNDNHTNDSDSNDVMLKY